MDLEHPPIDLRWFVDETSLGIGRALTLVRRDVVHPGHPLLPEVPLSTIDTDWMPVIAHRALVVITRDRAIRRRQGELAAFREHGLRSFWIAGEKDPSLSNWLYLTRIVRHWTTMERIVEERGPGPWTYALYDTNVAEVAVLPERSARQRPDGASRVSRQEQRRPKQLMLGLRDPSERDVRG